MVVIRSVKVREDGIADPLKVFLCDPETGRKVLVSSTRVLPTMDVDFLMRRGELPGFAPIRAEWHGVVNGSVYNLQDGSFYHPPDLVFEPGWLYGTVPPGTAVNITKSYLGAEDYNAGMVIEWGTVPGTLDRSMKFPVAADDTVPVDFPLTFHPGTYFRIGFYATKKNQTPTVHMVMLGFAEPMT
ncbi:MAG: hypothetical protein DRO39_06635 [Thermoprotei archaeon]|nr:MAG: hypothetical protein DRO39_06635 [Thermoprotei archaeon]